MAQNLGKHKNRVIRSGLKTQNSRKPENFVIRSSLMARKARKPVKHAMRKGQSLALRQNFTKPKDSSMLE